MEEEEAEEEEEEVEEVEAGGGGRLPKPYLGGAEHGDALPRVDRRPRHERHVHEDAALGVRPCRWCPPRHPMHCEPSFHESSSIL